MTPEERKQLEELQKEMAEYANYLYECTYHPFDKAEEFAKRLKDILDNER